MAEYWLTYSRRLVSGELSVEDVEQDESISAYDKRQIFALAMYSIEYNAAARDKRSKRTRRAMALLRSFLTPEQRDSLRKRRHFVVRGSLGNFYRLMPQTGMVWRVDRFGSRWRYFASYCLHDYAEDDPTFQGSGLPNEGTRSLLPAPDRTLAHMLMLMSDEREFRRLANESISVGYGPVGVAIAVRLRRERVSFEQEGVAA